MKKSGASSDDKSAKKKKSPLPMRRTVTWVEEGHPEEAVVPPTKAVAAEPPSLTAETEEEKGSKRSLFRSLYMSKDHKKRLEEKKLADQKKERIEDRIKEREAAAAALLKRNTSIEMGGSMAATSSRLLGVSTGTVDHQRLRNAVEQKDLEGESASVTGSATEDPGKSVFNRFFQPKEEDSAKPEDEQDATKVADTVDTSWINSNDSDAEDDDTREEADFKPAAKTRAVSFATDSNDEDDSEKEGDDDNDKWMDPHESQQQIKFEMHDYAELFLQGRENKMEAMTGLRAARNDVKSGDDCDSKDSFDYDSDDASGENDRANDYEDDDDIFFGDEYDDDVEINSDSMSAYSCDTEEERERLIRDNMLYAIYHYIGCDIFNRIMTPLWKWIKRMCNKLLGRGDGEEEEFVMNASEMAAEAADAGVNNANRSTYGGFYSGANTTTNQGYGGFGAGAPPGDGGSNFVVFGGGPIPPGPPPGLVEMATAASQSAASASATGAAASSAAATAAGATTGLAGVAASASAAQVGAAVGMAVRKK